MSCQLADEAMDDISPARLHLVSLSHDFRILLRGVFVKALVLNLSKNNAFEKGSYFVFWEVVGKLAHFIEKIDILIEDKREVRLKDAVDQEINVRFLEDMGDFLE